MQKNKIRKYAVILQHPWGMGEYPLGIVQSTNTRSASKSATDSIQRITAGSTIKIRKADRIVIRPWRKISAATRKMLIASNVRF